MDSYLNEEFTVKVATWCTMHDMPGSTDVMCQTNQGELESAQQKFISLLLLQSVARMRSMGTA